MYAVNFVHQQKKSVVEQLFAQIHTISLKKIPEIFTQIWQKLYVLLDISAERLNAFLLHLMKRVIMGLKFFGTYFWRKGHSIPSSLRMRGSALGSSVNSIAVAGGKVSVRFGKKFISSLSKVMSVGLREANKSAKFALPMLIAGTYFSRKLGKKVFSAIWKILKVLLKTVGLLAKAYGHFLVSNNPKEFFAKISLSSLVVASMLWLFLSFPNIILRVFPAIGESVVTAVDESYLADRKVEVRSLYSLPEKDESLPAENRLVIEKIGVNTQIREATYEDHEDALRQGVWRVIDFSTPMDNSNGPSIFVAHRYGYLNWSNQFRRENSFFNLDKLSVGDRFEVIWDQRKFTYEIYKDEEGQEVTDYQADVILYTCKHLNSPIRLFKYARRVEIGSEEVAINSTK